MPSKKDKILKFIQYMKSDKMSCIIYADIEYLISKKDKCANNPENSLTTKTGEHNPCGYSMLKIWAFDHIENKHNLYCGKKYMKKFCKSLREHTKNITDFEKKITLPLTKERQNRDTWSYYIFGKKILKSEKQKSKSINYQKFTDHCHYISKHKNAAHSIFNLKFNMPNETALVFHYSSNYNYHFILKQLAIIK